MRYIRGHVWGEYLRVCGSRWVSDEGCQDVRTRADEEVFFVIPNFVW